jgi:hypothetical protein
MNRRTLIRNLALVVGGAVLLPSCMHPDGTPYVQLKHISLDADQQRLIGDVCETIIPKTGTPGAKDLNLPQFVLKMIDDCYGKKDQEAFLAGLGKFSDLIKSKYSSSFSDLSPDDREAALISIENSNKPKAGAKAPARRPKPQKNLAADPLMAFYWGIKQQTIFAYTTSQYFMTKQIFYDMVPGRYNVHFPVSKLKLKLS